MKAKVKVTFEYEVRPPDTWSGNVTATAAHTIIARAVKKASTQYKPRNWTSCVAVILERSGTVSEIAEASPADA